MKIFNDVLDRSAIRYVRLKGMLNRNSKNSITSRILSLQCSDFVELVFREVSFFIRRGGS